MARHTKDQFYAGRDSNTADESLDDKDAFKKGRRAKSTSVGLAARQGATVHSLPRTSRIAATKTSDDRDTITSVQFCAP